MLKKTNIVADKNVYLFDKKTGEKFIRQSNITFCQIPHYTLKSEISGKRILLSADGIRRRFYKTPNLRGYNIKNLVRNLAKIR
ncbi:hypothetical protein N9809_00085 [Amylibacter sp.]|nr:hypothetical protein [Amylibacter sp.]